jgi:hypothetical protein
MDILTKPIQSFKFEDIVAFCKENVPEGWQIDYKEDFPRNGFKKHFAAFSNTRGGVIIIGVKEDVKSGVPIAWEGVEKNAEQIRKIHQAAGNVEPIPSYEVFETNEVNGKCFVLIRINEGDKTPYYVQNDFNVWVRTGNISNPISIASPDGLELLSGKKEKAEKARMLYLKMAGKVYCAGLEREENKRKKEIIEAEKKGENTDFKYKNELGTESVMCRIAIQPYFPRKAIIANPREIKSELNGLRFHNNYISFPDYNMESIPEGLFYFMHNGDGYIECQQIFGHGLIQNDLDILRTDRDKGNRKVVSMWFIAARIFVLLQFAKDFYNKFGYQGAVDGFISVDKVKDCYVRQLMPNRLFWSEDKENLLPNYKWSIELDTNVLNNKDELREYFISLLREIYWSFNFEHLAEDIVDEFLKDSGLSF